jgi:hypothetical protein
MLERMLDVGLGDLDLEPNAALRQLFDLRLHLRVIVSERF